MGYAIRNDGKGWRSIGSASDVDQSLEHFSETPPSASGQTANDEILRQIFNLELTVSNRRIREAILGIDDGWLKATNDKIVALRTQMTN